MLTGVGFIHGEANLLEFETEGGVFVYRVVGVAIDGGRVLIHRAERDAFWALPGIQWKRTASPGRPMMRKLALLSLLLFLILTPSAPSQAQARSPELTLLRDGDLVTLDVVTGTETLLVEDARPQPDSVVWSPDGSMLAFYTTANPNGELSFLDTRSGEFFEIQIVSESVVSVSPSGGRWSQDNRWLASRVYYFDPRTDGYHRFFVVEVTPEAQPHFFERYPTDVLWLPDNHRVILGGYQGYIRFDVMTGIAEALPIPSYEYAGWSPDGTDSWCLAVDSTLAMTPN